MTIESNVVKTDVGLHAIPHKDHILLRKNRRIMQVPSHTGECYTP